MIDIRELEKKKINQIPHMQMDELTQMNKEKAYTWKRKNDFRIRYVADLKKQKMLQDQKNERLGALRNKYKKIFELHHLVDIREAEPDK